jgi:hypothetical protein
MDAWLQIKNLDLKNEKKLIKPEVHNSSAGFFHKLIKMCSNSARMSSPSLLTERDHIFAYAKVKFNDKDDVHFRILYTIYSTLLSTDNCPRFGEHWGLIGF